jgi:hypothetical protein
MTIEFWPRRLLKPKPTRPRKPLPPRARRPKLPIRAGQAHQKLSQAIILGDHALASWLDLVVKKNLVIGDPRVIQELRERLDAVMEPLPT